jgi:vanillate O-demethylase monooxygenase subunit
MKAAEWLTNCWHVAAFSSEIGEKPLARRLLGEPVIMYRLRSGKAVALQDRCPHRFVPLSLGQRVGDEIQCHYHGLRFAGNGLCTHIPGQSVIPPNSGALTYILTERQGLAWIWMGAPELAQIGHVPDFPWLDDSAWRQSTGYHHFHCDYRLMNDNLLDLSHETYVHRNTIGNHANQTIADFPLEISVDGGTVIRAHREMRKIDPPPFFSMILNTDRKIDRWQTAFFSPPSTHMTEAGVHLAHTPRAGASISRVMHLLTPETAATSHYFWTVARNYHLEDAGMGVAIGKSVAATFDEDKVILEAQQIALGDLGDRNLLKLALKLDDAPLRARRLLSKLLRAQAEDRAYIITTKSFVPDEATTPAMTDTS